MSRVCNASSVGSRAASLRASKFLPQASVSFTRLPSHHLKRELAIQIQMTRFSVPQGSASVAIPSRRVALRRNTTP